MAEKIHFFNRNGVSISGALHRPRIETTKAYALFAHCFTCSKNINAAVNIAKALSHQGICTLRFDFTGIGDSEGKFADTTFSSNVQDLIDAAAFLGLEYEPPEIIIGHSLGGTTALAAAAHIDSIKAVATLGAPASPEHVLHHLHKNMHEIETAGQAEVNLAGRTFTFKQEFVDDTRNYELNISDINKPLMVMHSPIDSTVSIDEAAKIYGQAKHPKNFVSLDKADHLLSNAADSIYASNVLAAWCSRYLSKNPENNPEKNLEDGSVLVSGAANDNFLNHINAGGHSLVADEPKAFGGEELGPTPYQYLSTALGTCTSMTLNMYARRKAWPVENVHVKVSHDKVHAQDCIDCESGTTKIDKFTREISIDGDLSKEQKQRLLEIADRCPVHKTLERSATVETRLASS